VSGRGLGDLPGQRGLGGGIQRTCFGSFAPPVERVGLAEVPMTYTKSLEDAALVSEDKIAVAALATRELQEETA
jgi:pyruvate/2-oxoglutarate/acetoin dehydrogenase E1 component